MRRRHSRGFTLTEIMIAISIAAILLAVGIPQLIRMNRNTALAGAAEQVKGEFAEAAGRARTMASAPVLPSGYDPKAPSTITKSGSFDEVRVELNGATLIGKSLGAEYTFELTRKGPDDSTDLSKAVAVRLYDKGAAVGYVQAFDSSGAALWDLTFDMGNGYATQELHSRVGVTNVTVAPK
jgi:prepilin-type N-terminal cleavage/methylation domain-containing protein